jgi:hypothetical protein
MYGGRTGGYLWGNECQKPQMHFLTIIFFIFFLFSFCSVYLGRTWGAYARADFLYSYEGDHISPVGWNSIFYLRQKYLRNEKRVAKEEGCAKERKRIFLTFTYMGNPSYQPTVHLAEYQYLMSLFLSQFEKQDTKTMDQAVAQDRE